MYRGLARLVGMQVLPGGESITEQLNSLRRYYLPIMIFSSSILRVPMPEGRMATLG